MKDKLTPLTDNEYETDAAKSELILVKYDAIEDPTKFITRSFVVIWNEGHSVHLINRDDARKAISIPWDEIPALRACLKSTRHAISENEDI